MREIKFRAWDKNKNKMLSYYDLYAIDCSTEYPFLALIKGYYAYSGAGFLDGVDPVIMQYTGLKDKNGKEIYEGDIVKMHYFFENLDPYTLGVFEDEAEVTGTVRIDPFGTYTETEKATYDWGDYLQEPSEELEIIGNIYEDGHLLKK